MCKEGRRAGGACLRPNVCVFGIVTLKVTYRDLGIWGQLWGQVTEPLGHVTCREGNLYAAHVFCVYVGGGVVLFGLMET